MNSAPQPGVFRLVLTPSMRDALAKDYVAMIDMVLGQVLPLNQMLKSATALELAVSGNSI